VKVVNQKLFVLFKINFVGEQTVLHAKCFHTGLITAPVKVFNASTVDTFMINMS
jgi:hypothetical protein